MKYIVQFNENETPEGLGISMSLIHRKMNTYVTNELTDASIEILKQNKNNGKIILYYPNVPFELKQNTAALHHQYQKFHYVAKTDNTLDCHKKNKNGDDIVVAVFEPTFNLDHQEFNLWKNTPDITTNENIGVDYTWYTDSTGQSGSGTIYTSEQDIETDLNFNYQDDDHYGITVQNDSNGKPEIVGITNPSSYNYMASHATQVASVIGAYNDKHIPLTNDIVVFSDINANVGIYTNISATGGSGSNLTFDIEIKSLNDNSYISSIVVNTSGINYVSGDVLTISGSSIGANTDVTVNVTSNFINMINGSSEALINGVTGIAPGIKLLPVDFKQLNQWYPDHFILGLGYLTDLRSQYNADNTKGAFIVSVNMSFGIDTSNIVNALINNGVTNPIDRKNILEHMFTNPIDKAGEVGILSVATINNASGIPQDYGDSVSYLPSCICRDLPETSTELISLETSGMPKSSKYIISVVDVSTVYNENENWEEDGAIVNGTIRSDYTNKRGCIAGDGAIYKWPVTWNTTSYNYPYYSYGTSFVAPQVSGAIANLYGMISPSLLLNEAGQDKPHNEVAVLIKNTLIDTVSKNNPTGESTTSSNDIDHYTKCYGTPVQHLDSYCFSGGFLNMEKAIQEISNGTNNIANSVNIGSARNTLVMLTHGSENDDYWEEIIETINNSNNFQFLYETELEYSELTDRINYYNNNNDNIYGLFTTLPIIDTNLSTAVQTFSQNRPIVIFDSVGTNTITGALNYNGANQESLCESLIITVDKEIRELETIPNSQNYLFIAFNPKENTEWNFGTEARIKHFNQKNTSSALTGYSFNNEWPTTLNTITTDEGYVITPYLVTFGEDDLMTNPDTDELDIEYTQNELISSYNGYSSAIGNNPNFIFTSDYKIISLSMSSSYTDSNNITLNTSQIALNASKDSNGNSLAYVAAFDNTANNRNLVQTDDTFLACVGISPNDLASSVEQSMNLHYTQLNDPNPVTQEVITIISQAIHQSEGTETQGINPFTDSNQEYGPQTSGSVAFNRLKEPTFIEDSSLFRGPTVSDNMKFIRRVVDIKRGLSKRPIHIVVPVHIPEANYNSSNAYWWYYLGGYIKDARKYKCVLDISFSESNSDIDFYNNIQNVADKKFIDGSDYYDVIIGSTVWRNAANLLRELTKTRTVFITNMDYIGAPNVVHTIASNNQVTSEKRSRLFQDNLADFFKMDETGTIPRNFVFIAYLYLIGKSDFEARKRGLLTKSTSYPNNNLIDEFFNDADVLAWELNRTNIEKQMIEVNDNVLVIGSNNYGLPGTITHINNDVSEVTVIMYKDNNEEVYKLSDGFTIISKNNYSVKEENFKLWLLNRYDENNSSTIIERIKTNKYNNNDIEESKQYLISMGLHNISWRFLLEEKSKYYSTLENHAVIQCPVGSNFDMGNLCMSIANKYNGYMTDTRTDPLVRSNTAKYKNFTNVVGRQIDKEGPYLLNIIQKYFKNHGGSTIEYFTGLKPNYLFPTKLNSNPSKFIGNLFTIPTLGIYSTFELEIGNNSMLTNINTVANNLDISTSYSIPFRDIVYDEENKYMAGIYSRTEHDNGYFSWKNVRNIITEETRNINGITEYRYKIQFRWVAPLKINETLAAITYNDPRYHFEFNSFDGVVLLSTVPSSGLPTLPPNIDLTKLKYILFTDYSDWSSEEWNLNSNNQNMGYLKRESENSIKNYKLAHSKHNLNLFTTKQKKSPTHYYKNPNTLKFNK